MNQYVIQAALQEMISERDKIQNVIERLEKLIGIKKEQIDPCQTTVKPEVLDMINAEETKQP